MLVVRSQDREKLAVNDVVYVVDNYGTIYCDKVNFQGCFAIAKYSTEEKALKVLDMLEKFFTADKNGTFNFPKDYEVK